MENKTDMLNDEELGFCRNIINATYGETFRENYEVGYTRELLAVIEANLAGLPGECAAMLTGVYRDGRKPEDVGDELGVTDPEELRCIYARGMRMMRHPKCSRLYKPFITPIKTEKDC